MISTKHLMKYFMTVLQPQAGVLSSIYLYRAFCTYMVGNKMYWMHKSDPCRYEVQNRTVLRGTACKQHHLEGSGVNMSETMLIIVIMNLDEDLKTMFKTFR